MEPPVDEEDNEIKKALNIRINADTTNLPLDSKNISIDFSKYSDFRDKVTMDRTLTEQTNVYFTTIEPEELKSKLSGLGLTNKDTLYHRVYIKDVVHGVIVSETNTYDTTKAISVSDLTSYGANMVYTSAWYNSRAKMEVSKLSISPSDLCDIIVYYSFVSSFNAKLNVDSDDKRWHLIYGGNYLTGSDATVDFGGTGQSPPPPIGKVEFQVSVKISAVGANSTSFSISNTTVPSGVFDNPNSPTIQGLYLCKLNVAANVSSFTSLTNGQLWSNVDNLKLTIKLDGDIYKEETNISLSPSKPAFLHYYDDITCPLGKTKDVSVYLGFSYGYAGWNITCNDENRQEWSGTFTNPDDLFYVNYKITPP